MVCNVSDARQVLFLIILQKNANVQKINLTLMEKIAFLAIFQTIGTLKHYPVKVVQITLSLVPKQGHALNAQLIGLLLCQGNV